MNQLQDQISIKYIQEQATMALTTDLLLKIHLLKIELPSYDSIYSFKVTAINEGGESFDSEVFLPGLKPVAQEPF